MPKDKNVLPYRYDTDTAKALEKVKKITGIKVSTKAITHAVVHHPELVKELEQAHAKIEKLELLLSDIKEAQDTKLKVTKTLDSLIKKIPNK